MGRPLSDRPIEERPADARPLAGLPPGGRPPPPPPGPERPSRDGPLERRSKRGLMVCEATLWVGSGLLQVIEELRKPGWIVQKQPAHHCLKSLWPFHKPQRLRAVAPARHCCDPAAPDRVLLSRGARVLPASSTNGTGRQHEHRPRQHDAGRQNVLASTHGGAVDAAPTRHHQSKPAAMDPAVR